MLLNIRSLSDGLHVPVRAVAEDDAHEESRAVQALVARHVKLAGHLDWLVKKRAHFNTRRRDVDRGASMK